MHVEAIFRLVKDVVSPFLEERAVDLLPSIGGQAMENQRIGIGLAHKRPVELIGRKGPFSKSTLLLPTHRGPDIGVEKVSALNGLCGRFRLYDPRILHVAKEGAGRSKTEMKPENGRSQRPGSRYVARGIAQKSHSLARNGAALLLEGEDIGQDLAGMLLIGQGIHGGNPAAPGESDDLLLSKCSNDGSLDHPAQHARRILHRLSSAQLKLRCAKKDGGAPELTDRNLERDSRSR